MRLDRGSTLPRRLAVAAVLVVWAGAAAADGGSAVSGGTAMVNWQSWNNTCPSLVPIWSPNPPEQHARCRHTCHRVHCTLRVHTSARRTFVAPAANVRLPPARLARPHRRRLRQLQHEPAGKLRCHTELPGLSSREWPCAASRPKRCCSQPLHAAPGRAPAACLHQSTEVQHACPVSATCLSDWTHRAAAAALCFGCLAAALLAT